MLGAFLTRSHLVLYKALLYRALEYCGHVYDRISPIYLPLTSWLGSEQPFGCIVGPVWSAIRSRFPILEQLAQSLFSLYYFAFHPSEFALTISPPLRFSRPYIQETGLLHQTFIPRCRTSLFHRSFPPPYDWKVVKHFFPFPQQLAVFPLLKPPSSNWALLECSPHGPPHIMF